MRIICIGSNIKHDIIPTIQNMKKLMLSPENMIAVLNQDQKKDCFSVKISFKFF